MISRRWNYIKKKRERFWLMNECTFIILGATGDLTKRKLIPAIYKLVQEKKLKKFAIVGAAIDDVSADEFIDRGRSFIPTVNYEIWEELKKVAYYQKIDFNKQKDFNTLRMRVEEIEKERGLSGNRMVYLATPSYFFCDITRYLGDSGLVKPADDNGMSNGVWHRIVYEKPFGVNLASACETNECITHFFSEKQIYRIDHYLTKELVGNILLVRFTNMLFEPLWNKQYIDHVQIVLSESIGLEGRGRYYDKYGVLKDIVQNHALQLLALVAMELPGELNARHIRDQKAALLQRVHADDGLLGQYIGYLREQDVASNSKTPTFSTLRFLVDTPRWQGVPFFVKAGKRLDKKNSSIHIQFKEVDCSLRDRCMYAANSLTIQIDPDASFSVQLNTKKPGATYDVTPIDLSFSHDYVFGTATPAAYEVILEQIIAGEQSISVRFDEIEYSWRIVEKIEQLGLPLYPYEPGSPGPLALQMFDKKYGIRWSA